MADDTGRNRVPAAAVSSPGRFQRRRALLLGTAAVLLPAGSGAATYPVVTPGHPLAFPRDHGAHPQFRTEWWYVTGWTHDPAGNPIGIQVTFFRTRPGLQEDNPSRFAPTQLLFAHAAIADPRLGRLRHDQRAARAGFDLAGVSTDTTEIVIGDWSLALTGKRYGALVKATGFEMDLTFEASRAPLLQGLSGYSRKGPDPRQASYYYSRTHLATAGTLRLDGRTLPVTGEAWLDHEWSSEILDPAAVGWDWLGLNRRDGGSLTVFRIRDARGRPVWAGGTEVDAAGRQTVLGPRDVAFEPVRHWQSERTGTRYPVEMRVRTPGSDLRLVPLLDDQELDSRASVGTVYWEGAVRGLDRDGEAGLGYLELTGYWRRLRL